MASQPGLFIVIEASRGLVCSIAWERAGIAEAVTSETPTKQAQVVLFDNNIVKAASSLAFVPVGDRLRPTLTLRSTIGADPEHRGRARSVHGKNAQSQAPDENGVGQVYGVPGQVIVGYFQ
jgi:hypothetical protein